MQSSDINFGLWQGWGRLHSVQPHAASKSTAHCNEFIEYYQYSAVQLLKLLLQAIDLFFPIVSVTPKIKL